MPTDVTGTARARDGWATDQLDPGRLPGAHRHTGPHLRGPGSPLVQRPVVVRKDELRDLRVDLTPDEVRTVVRFRQQGAP
jgi:hypothetical protein